MAGPFYGSKKGSNLYSSNVATVANTIFCHGVAFTCVMVFRCPPLLNEPEAETSEVAMFLAAKAHVIAGMVIGALAVMAGKQVCKQRKLSKYPPATANPPQE